MDQSGNIVLSGDEVLIEHLVIRSSELIQYLSSFPAKEHVTRVQDALLLGAEVLQKAHSKSETDYIDRRFAEVSKEFGDRLNVVVNGVTKGLSELMTGTKSELTKLLSPRDNSSPLKERFEALDSMLDRVKKELGSEYGKVQDTANLLAAQFDVDGSEQTSHLGRLKKHIGEFEARVKELFDPKRGDSYFRQLQVHLDGIFDPRAGTLPGLLDERLAFEKPASPFGAFRKDVEGKLNDMREKVIESIGELKTEIEAYRAQVGQAAADREKMSAKGDDFEAAALELLAPFAEKRGDTVERVGTETESGTSKKGDLNYRFGGNVGLVAIEAKNQKVNSIPKFTQELLAGVRNRHASFGILVVRDPEHLPKGLGDWHFDVSTEGIGYILTHSGLLELSLKFAHARLRYAAAEVAGVDVSALKVLIQAVTSKLRGASAIKSNLTAIEDSVGRVRTQLDDLTDEIRSHMELMEVQLAKAQADASPG